MEIVNTDILVVGGGAAGCYAALRARDFFTDVTIVSKGFIGPGTTSATLGGGANICFPEDDKDLWMREIVERGEYLNDQEWVKIQLEEVYPLAKQLDQWASEYGFSIFKKDEKGNFVRRKARGNIHTLTAVIDGFPMMETMRRKVIARGVKIWENVMATNLFMEGKRVGGCLGFHYRRGEFILFRARAIILAAGGCSFKVSLSSPAAACTGEAQCMAYDVGAILRNLDQAMSQSNPESIEMHGMTLFASVGGKFVNRLGEEFMWRYDPQVGSRARLTRLVVGMAKEVDAGRGPIYMDLTGTSPEDREMLKTYLREPMQAFASVGLDPFRQLIPWRPLFFGTQIHGGGVHIDEKCATNIPGLYVAGDTSCTPEHGTWSITGLNIAFAWLSGYRAGQYASEYGKNIIPESKTDEMKREAKECINKIVLPIKRAKGVYPDEITKKIWHIMMPYKVCYLRNEERLLSALSQLERLRDEFLPQMKARDYHDLMKAVEVRSMFTIAEMILRSVLMRKESRGFVFREDYPYTDNINWLKWIMVKKEKEEMKVWAEEFPTPYIEPPREVYPPR